jgi:hypothetical protein
MARKRVKAKQIPAAESIPANKEIVYYPIYTSAGVSPAAYAFTPVDYGNAMYSVNFPGYAPLKEEKPKEEPGVGEVVLGKLGKTGEKIGKSLDNTVGQGLVDMTANMAYNAPTLITAMALSRMMPNGMGYFNYLNAPRYFRRR